MEFGVVVSVRDRGRVRLPRRQTGADTGTAATSAGRSPFRVEQPPGHGTNAVEEFEGLMCTGLVDRARMDEKPKVYIDLFG